jgi:hypothetical protein
MQKLVSTALLMVTTIIAAAQLRTPLASPNASVMQQVGITDITVTYSSPGVKGRVIWGDLVPYDTIWRAGANTSTKITLTTSAWIEGQEVKAGTYALGVIPRRDATWTLIIAKDGSYDEWEDYDPVNDVARVSVKPQLGQPSRERLAFTFNNTIETETWLQLEWEKVILPIRITIATDDLTMAAIRKVVDPSAQDLGRAARYCLDHNKNLVEALTWAAQADAKHEGWYYSWLHGALLDANGRYDEALVKAEEAWTLGEKDPDNFFLRDRVKKLVTDLKAKG